MWREEALRKNDSEWEKRAKASRDCSSPLEAPLLPLSIAPWCQGPAEEMGSEAWVSHQHAASQAVTPQLSTREFRDNSSGAVLLSLDLQHFHTG